MTDAKPSARQLAWHKLEQYAFLHFTINTFTDREWGLGDEDPNLFAPTAFDADAIVSALAKAEMRGVILTAKHHDGFCLWPTATTKHSVANIAWRNGKGDVVRDLSVAAAKQGLKFGVYLSPWDRNNAAYGTPAYIDIYRQQLRELLTNYGKIFEVWHDGANGGDGYYGGAREKRTIDKKKYYDWPATWELVRSLQPDAVIFSDVGPDIRWVGNEKGYANETCWSTYEPVGVDGGAPSPGDTRDKEGMTGHRKASARWLPAECDVSIRPGWFFHERENERVKTGRELFELYLKSVGRNSSFLLNVPPDRRGLIHEKDAASLAEFGRLLRTTFATNLALPKPKQKGLEWTVKMTQKATKFNVIRLREDISQGQRVENFTLDYAKPDSWNPFVQATSIGNCRILRLDKPVETDELRLRVTESSGPTLITEFAAYLDPG